MAWNLGIYTTYNSPWTKVVTNSMQAIPSFRNCSQNPMPSFQEEILSQELRPDTRATQTGSFSPTSIWSLKELQLQAQAVCRWLFNHLVGHGHGDTCEQVYPGGTLVSQVGIRQRSSWFGAIRSSPQSFGFEQTSQLLSKTQSRQLGSSCFPGEPLNFIGFGEKTREPILCGTEHQYKASCRGASPVTSQCHDHTAAMVHRCSLCSSQTAVRCAQDKDALSPCSTI